MKTFAARRLGLSLLLLVVAAAIIVLHSLLQLSLVRTAFVSGWTLLGLIVFLAIYNLRKKLTFLPLGSSAAWLQVHIYAGWLTFVVFVVHVDFRWPNGRFEQILTGLYLATFLSGVIGLALSRVIPARLTTRGEEVLFERIPLFVRRIRDHVEELVIRCSGDPETSAISDFYVDRLKPFFDRPRHFGSHLIHSSRPRHQLLLELESHGRYLNDTERGIMNEIADLVRAKDDLDYQYALQATLKYWLFFHIPLTYGLLIAAGVHLVLVSAFTGRAF